MTTYITECNFIVHGMPKSKSNHSLVNDKGKKILPKTSPYALYEKEIVNSILDQVGEKQFKSKVICVLNVFFKHKNRHPDLNNMTKSICDGIEKSCIIQNDRDIVAVYLDEHYDYDNPRVEISIYDFMHFKPVFSIEKRSEEEVEMLKEELDTTKSKGSKKKKKDDNAIICANCGKQTDILHAKPIVGSKEYICLKCVLVGC